MTAWGKFTIEPLGLDRDAALLHGWVTQPHAIYWGMQDASLDDVLVEYGRIDDDPHHEAFLGRVDDEPLFLVERYAPEHSELADHYEVESGDVGMHVLVSAPESPQHGFTAEVMRTVMTFLFDDPRCARVVVEPDVRNQKIAALNATAGFTIDKTVTLRDKTAALSFCTRQQFEESPLLRGFDAPRSSPYSQSSWGDPRAAQPAEPLVEVRAGEPRNQGGTPHLTPEVMERAHRFLVRKALSEFAHERIFAPEPDGDCFTVTTEDERTVYRFHAHLHELDHWVINPWSITRTVDGEDVDLDAQEFIVEFAGQLGIPDALLPAYVEEIGSTLNSAAFKQVNQAHTAAELLDADFQAIEAAMAEGHPAFVANNGRIGFGADDFAAYAPETGATFGIVWLAVRRTKATLTCGNGLSEELLYAAELDAEQRLAFDDVLHGHGLDPADYLLMPAHPWQWDNKLAITFAPDVARRDIVFLGESSDRYQAQQSIRTFFNRSRPERFYVKTALSILNMGFMRGLSPKYMRATPAINDWVAELVANDETLQEVKFGVLREHAAIGYTGGPFQAMDFDSPYKKMFSALWRESPLPLLAPGERLATMASLLHRDNEGKHVATALVDASGLDPAVWVRTYVRGYLRPLVHCLYRYELAFMPHGENLIMVLDNHVPTRMFMKDIGEEIAVMGDLELPEEVERVRADVPDPVKTLAILTDVFDGFFRYLAAILDEDGVLPAGDFWAEVGACVSDYQADHPELADAFARFDLFQPEFAHSCLNRLQLRNTLQMVDLSDQAESLIFAGNLANPIARFAPERG